MVNIYIIALFVFLLIFFFYKMRDSAIGKVILWPFKLISKIT